jgi:DNA repair exonuclease SbcCD ATPase subunit
MVIENFASFIGEHVFSLKEFEPGVYYIQGDNRFNRRLGPNGVGKSMLWNALTWCLYGRTASGLRAPDLKPWNVDETTSVKVAVFIDDKRAVIQRTARPNLLTIDGTETDQDHVDKLLRMPFALFRHTVLFGQGQPLFLDLPNKDRLSLFSDALNLDRWELRSLKASERTKELESRITELDGLRQTTIAKRIEVKELIKVAKANLAEWRRHKRAELDKLRMAISEREQLTRTMKRQLIEADNSATKAAKALGSLEADMHSARAVVEKFDREQGAIERERAVVTSNLERAKKALAGLKDNRKCPECGQPIKQDNIAEHRAKLKATVENYTEQLTKLESAKGREALIKKLTDLRVRLSALQPAYDTAKAAAQQIHRLKTEAEAGLEADQKLSARLQGETNPHEEQLAKLRKRLKVLKIERDAYASELATVRNKHERSKFWIKGFKDIRLLVIEEVLNELEITSSKLLEDMGLVGWAIQFQVERETKSGTVQHGMEITVTSPKYKKPVKWENWSGGEGQRLRLVGAMALSEVLLGRAGVTTDLEIFDEPTRGMGDQGVNDLIDLLDERAKTLQRRIMYTDHMAVENSQFKEIITITMTKKGSQINELNA